MSTNGVMRIMSMTANNSAWRSPWVRAWVATLLVVVSANVLMIYLAIDANPGLVVEDYYERGQDYEKNMVARMERDPRWRMRIKTSNTPPLATPVPINFSVMDKEGQPVIPDAVTFYVYRPSDAKQDFSVPMQQQSPGHYLADVSFPLKGVWDTLVSVQKGDEEYHQALRVIVAPGQ